MRNKKFAGSLAAGGALLLIGGAIIGFSWVKAPRWAIDKCENFGGLGRFEHNASTLVVQSMCKDNHSVDMNSGRECEAHGGNAMIFSFMSPADVALCRDGSRYSTALHN